MSRVNQTQFAKLVGVSEAMVRKGIKNGRLLKGADGLIDVEEGTRQWHERMNRDQVRGRGRPATVSTPEASRKAGATFDQLKTANLAADLAIKQEELKKLRADSVPKDDIRRALSMFAKLQTAKWTNFSSRFGAMIAADVGCDPVALMAALDRYVRDQLIEISAATPPVT